MENQPFCGRFVGNGLDRSVPPYGRQNLTGQPSRFPVLLQPTLLRVVVDIPTNFLKILSPTNHVVIIGFLPDRATAFAGYAGFVACQNLRHRGALSVQCQNKMQVVGHNDVLQYLHTGKVLRQRPQVCVCDFTAAAQTDCCGTVKTVPNKPSAKGLVFQIRFSTCDFE